MVRILVIEDDLDLAELARLSLAGAGTEVIVAHDGQAGLQALEDGADPDVILLDIQMPRVDGWEVLAALRRDSRTARVPVAICSVRSGAADRDQAADLGANRFLAKPYGLDELRRTVAELLDEVVTQPDRG